MTSIRRASPSGFLTAALALLVGGCDDGATHVDPPALGAAPPFEPVLRGDFADPFVFAEGDGFLAYASNRGGLSGVANVPMASSPDGVTWTMVTEAERPAELLDALPELPAWAGAATDTEVDPDEEAETGTDRGATWAPEIIDVPGGYVLYFTTTETTSKLQCVGVATSTDPHGPFVSTADAPFICQRATGGTIDPDPFRGPDGQLYLYFKNEGNRVGVKTRIWGQRLSADGLSLEGSPVSLVENDRPWEGSVVEAPTMIERDGGYILFFSGNGYEWKESQAVSPYAIGYATCDGPLGPCTDAPDNPLLAGTADPCFSGPGHQTVFRNAEREFLGFHAYAATAHCTNLFAGRFLHVAALTWDAGVPTLAPVE